MDGEPEEGVRDGDRGVLHAAVASVLDDLPESHKGSEEGGGGADGDGEGEEEGEGAEIGHAGSADGLRRPLLRRADRRFHARSARRWLRDHLHHHDPRRQVPHRHSSRLGSPQGTF